MREGIRFAPNTAAYKVFVIDECHMLTKEAFNALLKILEEPPAHAIFILATTEIRKVPSTIISRCQRFDFHNASRQDLKKKLNIVLKLEKRNVSDEALAYVINASGGSVRDAESLLGSVLVLGEDPDPQDVRALLGLSDMREGGGFFELLFGDKKE